MSDVKRYIQKRVENDSEFAENLEEGYADFKIGVILRQAREEAGLTQEEVARRLKTKKSAISRIENHADDVRLSTLRGMQMRWARIFKYGCRIRREYR